MFEVLSPIVFLIVIIWVYRDGLKLRKKGVNVYPGLVTGSIILANYLISWVRFMSFDTSDFSIMNILILGGNSFFSLFIQLFIPVLAYLILRFTWYQKIITRGNSPLPPASRWAFWFMVATFFIPIILLILTGLSGLGLAPGY